MGLTIFDIRLLQRGDYILYYCPKLGWAKAKILDFGLNYFHMKGVEGSKIGEEWIHDIHQMMVLNRYHLYIPPPKKKVPWIWWWIRQILMKLANRLPH